MDKLVSLSLEIQNDHFDSPRVFDVDIFRSKIQEGWVHMNVYIDGMKHWYRVREGVHMKSKLIELIDGRLEYI